MQHRVTVLLSKEELERLDEHCHQYGFKKSTLLARLLREYLEADERRSMPRVAEPLAPYGVVTRKNR